MSKAIKDDQWNKEEALKLLDGTLVNVTEEPNHQLIVQHFYRFSQKEIIDLWAFTKLLFEVHWLHVRDHWMSKGNYKDENEARCWWLIDESNVLIVSK